MSPVDLHPGLSVALACAGCTRHATDARAARADAAREHQLNLALTERLDRVQRAVEHLEQQLTRGRPSLLIGDEDQDEDAYETITRRARTRWGRS